MNEKQIKLRDKLFDDTIAQINKIRNEYLNMPLNKTSKKWKKHFPYSQLNDIEYINPDFNENNVAIKFKNNPNVKYYFTKESWKNNHSYTLSGKTIEEHVVYISRQLECQANVLKMYKNKQIRIPEH